MISAHSHHEHHQGPQVEEPQAHIDHQAHTTENPGTTANRSHAHHDHAAMMSDPAMAKEMERDMRRRFIIALVLTIPIVLITGHVPGLPMLVRPPVSSWIAFALAILIASYYERRSFD